jgi:hypothetical protein
MMPAPFSTTPDSCAVNCIAITPADADLVAPVRALYIGGAGSVRISDTGNGAVTFANVPAGVILPVMARRVWATGTSATNIVGLI